MNSINFKNSLSIFSGVSRFVPTLSPLQKTVAVVVSAIFVVLGLLTLTVVLLRRRRNTFIKLNNIENSRTQLPKNPLGTGSKNEEDKTVGGKIEKKKDMDEPIIEEMADPDANAKKNEDLQPTDKSRWLIVHPDSQKPADEIKFNMTFVNQMSAINAQQARSLVHPFNNTRLGSEDEQAK